MAAAYQCDRCMEYYTTNKEIPMESTDRFLCGITYMLRYSGGESKNGKYFELCDDCLKKLKDFMENRTDFT